MAKLEEQEVDEYGGYYFYIPNMLPPMSQENYQNYLNNKFDDAIKTITDNAI